MPSAVLPCQRQPALAPRPAATRAPPHALQHLHHLADSCHSHRDADALLTCSIQPTTTYLPTLPALLDTSRLGSRHVLLKTTAANQLTTLLFYFHHLSLT